MEIYTAEELNKITAKKEKRRKIIKLVCFFVPIIALITVSRKLWAPELPWNQEKAKTAAKQYVQSEYGGGFTWYDTRTCMERENAAFIGCYDVYFHTQKHGDMYVTIAGDMTVISDDFFDIGESAVRDGLLDFLETKLTDECKEYIKGDIMGFRFHHNIDYGWSNDIYVKELPEDELFDELLKNEDLFCVYIKMNTKPDKANIDEDADAIFHITKYLVGRGLSLNSDIRCPAVCLSSPYSGTAYSLPDIDYTAVSDEDGVKAVKELLETKDFNWQ